MDRESFEPLVQTLRKLGPIGDAVIELLRDGARVQTFDREAWLLRGGEIATACFWIESGLAREYYLGED
jgi:hypothetical protein